MFLTRVGFIRLFPGGAQHYDHLAEAADSYDINRKEHEAAWLGQCAHECTAFMRLRESLNYSVEGLIKNFNRSRISKEEAERYGRKPGEGPLDDTRQAAIANILYGREFGKTQLGNNMPGDGWAFIGRGDKMLTGKANYGRASRGVHGDDRFLHDPGLLELPSDAALAAGWFWRDNALGAAYDRGGVRAVTMRVTGWKGVGTGDTVGLQQRQRWTDRILKAIQEG